MKDSSKVKFYLEKDGFFAESAVILLVLAAIFRVIGCFSLWDDRARFVVLLLLPVCCCVLMVLCILLFGKKVFFLSCIPVLLGMVFFVCLAFDFGDWVYTVPIILLCLAVSVVYTATVFGWIRTKWLLPPLFALPFLYQLAVKDIPALMNNAAVPVSFVDGMQEMSILFILAGMFCVSMGLKKRIKEKRSAKAEPKGEEPAPAPAAQAPAQPSAPAPETPAPAPAPQEPAPAEPVVEENPFLSDKPYTPVLTLDPAPLEPEEEAGESSDESGHE